MNTDRNLIAGDFTPSTGRREFLKAAGKGGVLLAFAPLSVRAHTSTEHCQSGSSAARVEIPDEILFTSAKNLARLIREKKISSLEVVESYFERIDRVNPKLNAVVLLCRERALLEAKEADALLSKGTVKGPLHGVPMTIKDSLETQGVVSTGGTLGRKNYIPGKDATAVDRLRKAGAILLGKTNTPELTLSGWTENLVYGRTHNPYDLAHSPGGSSGGAAAIIATGGSPFDIGSDFGGSIRSPAHCCGIAGIKPTSGRVPRTGHIVDYGGIFDAYQQIGPLARWVEDLDLILPIISGPDYIDAGIVPMTWGKSAEVDLNKLRVAFYTHNGSERPTTPATVETVAKVVGILESEGLKVEEDIPLDLFKEAEEVRRRLSRSDGSAWIRRLLTKYGTKSTHPRLRLGSDTEPSPEFTALAERLDSCRSRMLQWLQDYDVIICPARDRPAPRYDEEEPPRSSESKNYSHTGIYNMTGWPAAVIRAGTSPEGLPIGIQIVGRPWREDVVLATAYLIEARTGGWKPPSLT